MHYVGAPQITVTDPSLRRDSPRNPIYQFRTADTPLSDVANDPTSYTPGSLLTLHLRVTKKWVEARRSFGGVGGMFACWPQVKELFDGFVQVCGESWHVRTGTANPPLQTCPGDATRCTPPARDYVSSGACGRRAGQAQCRSPHPWIPQIRGNEVQAWEPANYLGLMIYAVSSGGAETKVGSWEIPPESPRRFWTPLDSDCGGKTLMHADARPKRFHHSFHFRAPPAGTGSIIFRVLVKQGYTNGGAFYWPLAPAMPNAKDDLALTEGAPLGNSAAWFTSATAGATCAEVGNVPATEEGAETYE